MGGPDPRSLWPNILDAVKGRRRFTWILLSQNAQVAGFDGTTLQIGFVNAGARDNFASSGSEDVLRQALSEQFGVQWKVEAIVDPSGGSAPPPAAGNFGGSAPPPARPAPQQPQQQSPQPSANRTPAPASTPAPAPAPERRVPDHVSAEDDMPADDDPDLVESALSGHDLIVRELGATIVEEYNNEP
jgi:DNA polymerase-3 subunit gamma/tau